MIFMTDQEAIQFLEDLEKRAERLDNQAELAYQEWLNARDEAVGRYLKDKQIIRQGQAEYLRGLAKDIGVFFYLHKNTKEQ